MAVWNDKTPAGATYVGNMLNLRDNKQVEFCWFADNEAGKPRTEAELMQVYDECPKGSLVAIAMSDPIPNTPFAIRSDLPASFKATVKAALLEMKDIPTLVEKTANWYVDPHKDLGLQTLDQFYNSLRDIAKLLDLNLKELVEKGG
jgi:ABC-type phosphate/phosphonate transport system substrate-binding protein